MNMQKIDSSAGPPPLLSIRDVCRLTTLSRSGINKARAAGRFPKPIQLDGKRLAFVTDEVLAWIADRVESGRVAQ